MNVSYAAAYKCDRCGKITDGGRWDWGAQSAPAPDGWLIRLEFMRVGGIVIHDLCDDCSMLPIRQIAQELKIDA